jgi:nitrogen fixation NifU-like protein
VTGELDESAEPNHLGRLTIFAGVRDYPARVKCASLAWHTMHAALEGEDTATTENLGPDLTEAAVSD